MLLVAEAEAAAEPADAVPDIVLDPDWDALPAAPVDAAEADVDPVEAVPLTLDEAVPDTPANV